jgi:hypothetical protein
MYGDMQGIIGDSFPQIKSLELTALIPEEAEANEEKNEIPS